MRAPPSRGSFDVDIDSFEVIRKDFPVLSSRVHGHDLVYLDNAATCQLPEPVIELMAGYWRTCNANVHRSSHALSARSTRVLEEARETVARFIGAARTEEIVFTKSTTDAINLVAHAWDAFPKSNPDVMVTAMEHHANLVPWQKHCERTGSRLHIAPLTPSGDLDLATMERLLEDHPIGLVAVTCVSNVLGTANPIQDIVDLAHRHGSVVLLDAAQAMRHESFDVASLGCDFLCFSGHKAMGPMGIGVLYGRAEHLAALEPVEFGGEMVRNVSLTEASFQDAPLRFEAGTPNVPGACGLAAAIEYLEGIGIGEIAKREERLLGLLEAGLAVLPDVHVLGSPERRCGCISIVCGDAHPFDMAALLDALGIAVRAGHMCAQPLVNALGYEYVLRFSPAFYNTFSEIDYTLVSVEKAIKTIANHSL